ncbi:aminopeptidase [Streptomyces sp. NPDC052114]|uniref:aminopeptidase n=1 Tax=unclassified Streptomyces TaxID=2593676 RepID=UPI003429BEA4
MSKALRWLVSLVVLIGTMSAAGATTGAATAAEPATTADAKPAVDANPAAEPDIKDRLLAVPGMSLIEEKLYPGYRFFVLNYTQPVDHRHPSKGTFKQRLTVLHKDTDRPTVFYTSGYNVSTNPSRREPTQIVDGNQISMEYRYFAPSRPEPADWSKLDSWQGASDQHRLYRALKSVYGKKWLATGVSKGGMTATAYERFYPRDMAGVVAYVAPNDVDDKEDSAYDAFFANVGTKECRDRIQAVQREALTRRGPLSAKLAALAEAEGYTFKTVGTLDKVFEAVVMDLVWGFWQYQPAATACGRIPDAATVSDQALYDYVDDVVGWSFYTDQGLDAYVPYYYQAGTELGSPDISQPWLGDLSRYGYQPPRNFVPREIPMTFDPRVMRDADRWVRHHGQRMMYVYGEYDPYGAERYRPARGAKHDNHVFTAPGANHGATVSQLTADEKARATQRIQAWAGVSAPSGKPLAAYDKKLDRRDAREALPVRR